MEEKTFYLLDLIGGETPMWKFLAVVGNEDWNPVEVKARNTDLAA